MARFKHCRICHKCGCSCCARGGNYVQYRDQIYHTWRNYVQHSGQTYNYSGRLCCRLVHVCAESSPPFADCEHASVVTSSMKFPIRCFVLLCITCVVFKAHVLLVTLWTWDVATSQVQRTCPWRDIKISHLNWLVDCVSFPPSSRRYQTCKPSRRR